MLDIKENNEIIDIKLPGNIKTAEFTIRDPSTKYKEL
jgi:hypothetical protein